MLALLAAAFVATPAFAGQRIALVIGNSAYRNAPQLENPRNDAELMAGTLELAGFSVTRLIDADYRSLKRALVEFGRSLRGPDIEAGLFYYAGHGVQVRGENYLIPVNAAITSEDEVDLEAINVNDFLRVMNSSDAAVNIVILDACRDNPFKGSSRSMGRGLAPIDAPKGTYIAYATAPGEVALDGANGNSPYTRALTRAIAEPGLPIERVFKKARVAVLEETGQKQVPWEVSSITGEFFFRDANRPAAGQPAPPPSTSNAAASAFALAEKVNSAAAWQAFIDQFAAKAPFYGELARQKLAALAPPEPAPRRSLDRPTFPNQRCLDTGAGFGTRSVCVSSVLDPQYGNRYGGGNLFDGNPATAWVEGVGGQGEGESIVVEFDRPRSPTTIEVLNGYTKSAAIFAKNSRVRVLELRNSAGEDFTLQLEDSMDWQRLSLPAMQPCDWISLTIRDVYPGSKYQDTAISELRLQ